MAEKSTPNTFTGGMITDFDPAFQPKDSYFDGLNIRVVSSGDKSYSLENIKDIGSMNNVVISNSNIYGAIVVDNRLITIQRSHTSSSEYDSNTWFVVSNSIIESNLSTVSSVKTVIWAGFDLFSSNAEKIEIESIVETGDIKRIYCTDGLTPLKSINIGESQIGKSVDSFLAFKPTLLTNPKVTKYSNTGGNLKYGSYSYIYRLSSDAKGNYTDWSSISNPANVANGNPSSTKPSNMSGDYSSDNSTSFLELEITNINTNYNFIQVAAIYYSAENVSTISIVEEGPIINSNYKFVHSGFEVETLVTGGLAAAIINNDTWDVCKILAKKDNKLYAANLKTTSVDVDSIISGFGKLKSYKAVESGGNWSFETHSGDANPHRFKVGGDASNSSWHPVEAYDRANYKFIKKQFTDGSDPVFILGAETSGYSDSGNDGFRITFTQKDYYIDDQFHLLPDGTQDSDRSGMDIFSGGYQANEIFKVDDTRKDNDWDGFPGPQNPKWDAAYRSFKRNRCYRFGIVFYDKNGNPGFVHHLGDIKMPDALDPNGKILNSAGDNFQNKNFNTQNSRWSPFSGNDNEVVAHALIPRIEVRLPQNVRDAISGYKIVRAEVQENDKVIMTQGLMELTERHNPHPHNENSYLRQGGGYTTRNSFPYYSVNADQWGWPDYINRTTSGLYTIESPDTTIGNKTFDFNSEGFKMKYLYIVEMNRPHTLTSGHSNYGIGHKHQLNGYPLNHTTLSNSYGMHFIKHRIFPEHVNSNSNFVHKTIQYQTGGNWDSWIYFNSFDFSLCRTIVSGEIITASEHQGNTEQSFVNYTPGYDNHESSADSGQQAQWDDGTGGANVFEIGNLSRASYTDGANATILFSYGLTGNSNHLPLLSSLTIKYGGSHSSSAAEISAGRSEYSSLFGTSGPADDSAQYAIDEFGGISQRPQRGTTSVRRHSYKYMVEIFRDTSNGFEQYGGHEPEAISKTPFYDCSDFVSVTSQRTSSYITKGDTYCGWYAYKWNWILVGGNSPSNDNTDNSGKRAQGAAIPVESDYNLSLRHGEFLGSTELVDLLAEDNYFYNTAYSQENNLVSSVTKPYGFVYNDTFEGKVVASKTKVLGERNDAWTIFPANDFIDLDLSKGKITDLVNFKNNLYCVQESGVSLLSINSRSLITGEGAAADIQIVSGTGTAIERFDYITDVYGSQYFNQSLITPTGFYFYDHKNSEIIKYDGNSLVPISSQNNYKYFVKNFYNYPVNNLYGISLGYDPEFKECHFSIKTNGYYYNFLISDLDGKLISNVEYTYGSGYDFYPIQYFSHNGSIYSTHQNGVIKYNYNLWKDYKVSFVVNDNPSEVKVFDSSEIISDKADPFTDHIVQSSASDEQTITESKIKDGVHKLALRSGNNPRIRGNWMKQTIEQHTVGGAIARINIFAVNTRIRKSR